MLTCFVGLTIYALRKVIQGKGIIMISLKQNNLSTLFQGDGHIGSAPKYFAIEIFLVALQLLVDVTKKC